MPGRYHTIEPSSFGGYLVKLYDADGDYVTKVRALTIGRAEKKGKDWDSGAVAIMNDWF